MLVPKRVKHRREFRGKMRGEAKGGKEVSFGEYGLQATTSHWITNRQIEAARIAMTRYMKRGGKVWIKIFPHKSYTAKAIGVRMGSGKGAPEGWVAPVKRGKVMFEIAGVSEEVAREALRLASHKLPVKCSFVACLNKSLLKKKTNLRKNFSTFVSKLQQVNLIKLPV